MRIAESSDVNILRPSPERKAVDQVKTDNLEGLCQEELRQTVSAGEADTSHCAPVEKKESKSKF